MSAALRPAGALVAARIRVRGAVQGTGFRPFAWRLAHELGLRGWIRNTAHGVLLLVEGDAAALAAFTRRLPEEAPPGARLAGVAVRRATVTGAADFVIGASATRGVPTVAVQPDLATCDACRRELFDPADRRYRYPFLNCTVCGPRFTIVEGLPYDRARTVMADFALCARCAHEYGEPADRRFHAQPVACPQCGPRLVWSGPRAPGQSALAAAVALVRRGGILALQGVGGFQLVVDARNEAAVRRLRERKGREAKPFAVMFPGVASLRRAARLGSEEADALRSPASPIVLLARRHSAVLADAVAPGLATIGALLPYAPLHHLLLDGVRRPVVMTSGNLAEEPIATDPDDARTRLAEVADGFLCHDRRIARPVDDSVVRIVEGRLQVLRRARGYAPVPLLLRAPLPVVRALGGHLKNTVAWTHGTWLTVSQHIGDLDHPRALAAHQRCVRDFERLLRLAPRAVACDLHPDYATTRLAEASGLPVVRVQHHHAHAASLMAEHDLDGTILAVAWDGTGYGPDGTVWGGEFLAATRAGYTRVARLLPFPLPGAVAAARQPWRSALGVLHRLKGPELWRDALAPVARALPHARTLAPLLDSRTGTWTSSAGRLFDAVASLLDLAQESAYEAEAAQRLEQLAGGAPGEPYPFTLREHVAADPPLEVDWRPAVAALLDDLRRGHAPTDIADRVHATFAAIVAAVAAFAGLPRVGLTGGCFQNARLATLAARALRETGCAVYLHGLVPPGDGGLAVGQALVAAQRLGD